MGTWGDEPWDNDAGADWFATFFRGIDVDERIEFALDSDDFQEVRAACYVLAVLGRVYVWPGDFSRLARSLEKAIALLKSAEDEDYEDIKEQISKERRALEERRMSIHD
ncbi:MAG: DUF4259 domain-containing protein [Myxococcota bacterium]